MIIYTRGKFRKFEKHQNQVYLGLWSEGAAFVSNDVYFGGFLGMILRV